MTQAAEDPASWTAVDRFVTDRFGLEDEALAAALAKSQAAGLPAIQVSAPQGKWLHLLARAMRARRILEIGTLGGYSAIWLARALEPGGRLVTLEVEPRHAEVARANLARAGLAGSTEVRLGPGLRSLEEMGRAGEAPFDLVFLDADKPGYPDYLLGVLPLVRRGSVIVADNVVRGGAVADPKSGDPNVLGVRRYLDLLAEEPRLESTVLQTVGNKGYDGFAVSFVTGD